MSGTQKEPTILLMNDKETIAIERLRLAVAATRSWREKRPVKLSEIQA